MRWDEGQQLVVEANPDYYGQKPAFGRVVFLFTEEDATLALAKAGDVHLAAVAQSFATEPIPGMRLVSVDSVDNRGMMLPTALAEGKTTADGYPIGNAVTSNLAIRQAINVVVDREALVAGVLDGFGSPAVGPVDGLPWFEADVGGRRQRRRGGQEDPRRRRLEGRRRGRDRGAERPGGPVHARSIRARDTTRQGLALAAGDMIRTGRAST